MSIDRIVFAFAGAMILVTVLLIANAMRVAAFNRRRETGIMRALGATAVGSARPLTWAKRHRSFTKSLPPGGRMRTPRYDPSTVVSISGEITTVSAPVLSNRERAGIW